MGVAVCLLMAGCANTQSGKGFDFLDEDKEAKALPYIERAARQDRSKVAAVVAGFLYLSNYQIPRDLNKAKEYYDLALQLEYRRYDQYLDYFLPIVKAQILLYDQGNDNDQEGIDILRGERYSEFSPTLALLAKCYAFGKGVDKNLKLAKLLFQRAIEYDDEVYSSHYYAWWLAVHPDKEFRDGTLALALMDEVMQDEEESVRAVTLDTMAVRRQLCWPV